MVIKGFNTKTKWFSNWNKYYQLLLYFIFKMKAFFYKKSNFLIWYFFRFLFNQSKKVFSLFTNFAKVSVSRPFAYFALLHYFSVSTSFLRFRFTFCLKIQNGELDKLLIWLYVEVLLNFLFQQNWATFRLCELWIDGQKCKKFSIKGKNFHHYNRIIMMELGQFILQWFIHRITG